MSYRFAFKRFAVPFQNPVRTAHGWWTEREGVWIRLTSEAGDVAYGEAAPIPAFGTETIDDIEGICRALPDPVSDSQLDALGPSLGCVRFAFRSAREDLKTAYERREGPSSPPVPIASYLSLAALLPAGKGSLEKVRILADAGFRTFKWKVGVGDLADELGLLDDLLSAMPTGAKLRLDANGAWSRRQAQRWLERAADRPIEFIEQPISPDARDVEDSLLGLASEYPTPLALDESVATGYHVERWLDLGWPGVLVLKPSLLGDVAGTVERIKRSHTPIVFSSVLETKIGARSALRIALTYGEASRAIGFGVWPLFSEANLNGPSLAPFIRREDVERIDPSAAWNALN